MRGHVAAPLGTCCWIITALIVWHPLLAASELPQLALKRVAPWLDEPVAIANAGDARLFVVEKAGRVLVVRDQEVLDEPFLDISTLVESGGFEQGLLSIAFHPLYAENGRFFVTYTDLAGDLVLARYEVSDDPQRAEPESARTLLELSQPSRIHNGGQLQFGPDGWLYVGVGDGGDAFDPLCSGQRTDTLLGKILRLDVDSHADLPPFYTIPADNPILEAGELLGPAWARGLRNPWRFSFDRLTGDLYIADVGQQVREEVNFQPAGSTGGENYGWKVMEGSRCTGTTEGCPTMPPPCGSPSYTSPVIEYEHTEGNCAVIGGYVYRGRSIPELFGTYLYADFCSSRLWAARPGAAGWESVLLPPSRPAPSSFGEDVNGEIYLTTLVGGLFRLRAVRGPGLVELLTDRIRVGEGEGEVAVVVRRSGGNTVSVSYETHDLTARARFDYRAAAGTLTWEDGDFTDRVIRVPIIGDAASEGREEFRLTLVDVEGASLGTSELVVEIADDDRPVSSCSPAPDTLCLTRGRFQVDAVWETSDGERGQAEGTVLTADTGMFWFFDDANVELLVKMLDACSQSPPAFWLFATGLTDLGVELRVLDTLSGRIARYVSPPGEPFSQIQDTGTFVDCP